MAGQVAVFERSWCVLAVPRHPEGSISFEQSAKVVFSWPNANVLLCV